MVLWRLIAGYLWRSKGGLAFTLAWLVVTTSRPDATSGAPWVFDAVRALLPLVPLGSRLLGRETRILPVSEGQIWRARWLLATVGVTTLTTVARLLSAGLSRGSGAPPIAFLAFVDFVEAGTSAACMAYLLRRHRSPTRMVGRILRLVVVVGLLASPWWTHVVEGRALALVAWTPSSLALGVLGLVATLFGARAAHSVVLTRRIEVGIARRQASAWTGGLPPKRPGAGVDGSLRLLTREALRVAGVAAAGFLVVAALVRVTIGSWAPGQADALMPGYVFMGVLGVSTVRRARLLRVLPVSTDMLVLLPTLLVFVGWAVVAAVFTAGYRILLGVWPPSPVPLFLLELVAASVAAKTASLASGFSFGPLVVAVPIAAVIINDSVAGTPRTAVPVALMSAGLVVASLVVDYVIFTRAKRIYRPRRSIWA